MWLPTKSSRFLGLKEWASMPGLSALYLKLVIADTIFLMYTQYHWSVCVCLCIYIIWHIFCNTLSYSRNDYVYPAFIFSLSFYPDLFFSSNHTLHFFAPIIVLFQYGPAWAISSNCITDISERNHLSALNKAPPQFFRTWKNTQRFLCQNITQITCFYFTAVKRHHGQGKFYHVSLN